MDDTGAAVSRAMCRAAGAGLLAVVLSAHVGSPDVFFTGRAGPYDVRVVVRPPEVVPGVARVTVRAPAEVQRVSIRPVYWRAGTRGAPAADDMRRLDGESGTFEGSLWLMSRGAYTVDVRVEGSRGAANVLVPVASVATGRLGMTPGLGVVLTVFGFVLVAGLINIVYKSAGESLVEVSGVLESTRRRRARRVAALAVPVVTLLLVGGARWWHAVDTDYQRTIYRPSPLALSLRDGALSVVIPDGMFLPSGKAAALIPDHGKLMHLFLVRSDDARAFAHLHPQPKDTSPIPDFSTTLPPLPSGTYHVYGDVVHETGFERTLVGSLAVDSISSASGRDQSSRRKSDADDAWFVGDAAREKLVRLRDGSTIELAIVPNGLIEAGREETIRISVREPDGTPATLEPYLGMSAHAVIVRVDGAVYVHLHPMGTITTAAQEAFLARDRGDTSETGRLRLSDHPAHASAAPHTAASSTVEFPYAFPKSGSYRLFVQVKKKGQVLTGAYAITVAEPVKAR